MIATMKWMAALAAALCLAIPVCGESEILGRPTDRSVTVTALADRNLEVFFEYGTAPGIYTGQTAPATFSADTPIEVVLDGLEPNTRYHYRARSREPGAGTYAEGPEYTFHTARPRGESFTVAVQADPHMDGGSSPELYRLTLGNELRDQPDFLVDLGDIFMSDKLRPATYEGVAARHLELRDYYELVCHSMPLFIVLGNHEGEWGTRLDGTSDNLPIWATRLRKLYYPNPFPDGFYTGSTREEPFVGLRENYYAWEWGDALFVVLDPFWYIPSPPESRSGGWSLTLGREQYDWLRQTLEASEATFKFVFAHNLVGGQERNGKMRGG
ncbi:MAG: metallophosphoesterase family protein, partial [bacterium]|nr:metallophosphoesterase family protein [bacterium]